MMGRDRIADHVKAGAEVITGTDVSCLMHMDGLARRTGREVGSATSPRVREARP